MNAQRPTADILDRIVATKLAEVAEAKQRRPWAELAARAEASTAPRGFAQAIAARVAVGRPAVIAEIKKASPSKGLLREDFDPAVIARAYEVAGATCLSVLTDLRYFQGSSEALVAARAACALPVLRKDFTIDAYQLVEARAMGADCVLLIVAILDDAQIASFADRAIGLGMDVLIEAHDAAELDRALAVASDPGRVVIGVNNRDLRTFETRLDTTLELVDRIPRGRLLVTESGIATRDDIARMRHGHVHGFLIGETFMRADDPGQALAALFA
jgi:indole-3-glycerol phosphate synthase